MMKHGRIERFYMKNEEKEKVANMLDFE